MNSIGRKVYNLRKQNNMSQEQLAETLNVSRQSVSKWERDEALPDIYNLETIAEAFSVSIDYIIKKDLTSTSNDSSIELQKLRMKHKDKSYSKANLLLIIAFTLYLIDVFVVGGMIPLFQMNALYTTPIFILIAIIATGIIVWQGVIRSKLNKLYQEQKFNKDKDKNNPLLKIFSSIALIIILISGFVFGVWYPTVVLMPISGLLALVVNTIMSNQKNNTNNSK